MANDLHRCLIPSEDGVNAIGIDLLRPEDRSEMENVLFVYTICLLALNETEIEMIALFSFFRFLRFGKCGKSHNRMRMWDVH